MKKFFSLVVLLCAVMISSTATPNICYARGYHGEPTRFGMFLAGIVWMGICIWLWSAVVHIVKRFIKNRSSDDLKAIILISITTSILSLIAFSMITGKY